MFSRFIIRDFQSIYDKPLLKGYDYGKGKELLDSHEKIIKESFQKINNGTLKAKDIEDDWFPKIDCHMFISHSHQDFDKVISLVGWLHCLFGIEAFVDAVAWKNVEDLKESLINMYQSSDYEDKKKELDRIASINSYLILNSALEKMIDSTECFVFIDTENSLVDGRKHTKSPWIYTENLFSNLVRHKTQFEHRHVLYHSQGLVEALAVEYECNFENYIELTEKDLSKMFESFKPFHGIPEIALNGLYKIKGLKIKK